MRTPSKTQLFLGLALLFVSSCGRTLFSHIEPPCQFDRDCPTGLRCVNQVCRVVVEVDAGRNGFKRFGEKCDAGPECISEKCVGGPSFAFCTESCEGGSCPYGYDCKVAPNVGTREISPVCTVPTQLLCQNCEDDWDCGASGGDLCIPSDAGERFCGRDCNFAACPPLYRCESFSQGRAQCVPEKKTCDCIPETLGMMKGCRNPNKFGACQGHQTCQLDGGFTLCNAPPAAPESCNGVDDECDGFVDNFTPPTCSKTVGNRTCTGPQVCLASAGLVCNAPTPSDEVCNNADDDCNGKSDEPFTDDAGRYLLSTHCGGCNRDCKSLIPHSLDVSCALSADAGSCRVSRCEAGYFPNDGGTWCSQLPDTLCRACAVDSDCLGPNAKCLTIDGEKVCGRDCSPQSLYATGCPSGYVCQANQCQPSTGSCNCKPGIPATRSCSVKTCRGFQSCAGGSTPMWSACDVASFNPEVCDGIDNNCNDAIDEGFRNSSTGKYDLPTHCGFCNNDCTKYFSESLQHTRGVCNSSLASPQCEMGPCLTETVSGTQYEWVNVDGVTTNGCECRRVFGNTTVDEPEREAPYVDENCDGVDGVAASAVFVSANAAPGGNGSRTLPFQTLAQGLLALDGVSKKWVLVAQGVYRENVRLENGDQMFGGYSGDFLKHDPKVHSTVIVGQPVTPGGARAAIEMNGVGTISIETVVAGFSIFGWEVTSVAPLSTDGPPSVAMLLKDCGPNLVVTSNDIYGGRGGEGGRGRTGDQGFGRQDAAIVNGLRGTDSSFVSNRTCDSTFHKFGGSAGSNPICPGTNAQPGGSTVCPQYDLSTFKGAQQQYVTPSGNSGPGGFDWSFDSMSGSGCSHVTESGFPTNIQPHDGADGQKGAEGIAGIGGRAASSAARHGTVSGGVWVASSFRPQAGTSGTAGKGGGGGGAGGGVARFTSGCTAFEMGASGGGGGAGACGGNAGDSGGAGGASIAVLVSYTVAPSPGQTPRLTKNRIERGVGGLGGSGGFGGAGGLGGSAALGGVALRWSSSNGGKGGEGGNGGPGGGGAGGTGGPSFGILATNVDATTWASSNTFLTPATSNPGGLGGAGGSSASAGTGEAGVRGTTADTVSLFSCSPGCSAGLQCDLGMCVPQ